ncbi:hypothetical protein DUI87_26156 [Hirundo rustica rustica]|uniref:Retropepsins domain-containing protein n=1 Tax=Hirundo rustica rustica TaxID=333673 RepID=A0A3M0J7M8_HIRRU|nr:hypothetical protein DUI87_26156 [Hirundo rustica rustica]
MDVAAAIDVTIMTTNPLKIPTGLIGPIIINGQPDLSGFQLGGRSQHQNLKVEDIRNPQLHLDGLVRLHQKFLLTIELDKKFGLNDLVLIPEADNNLLGRDLIIALGIKITPCEGKLKIHSLTEEDNFEISDTVWYTGEAGKLNIQPISIEIQNPEIPIPVKRYPISLEGRKGLKPVVENSVHQGVLESCVSPQNTPILPVKKPDGSYRLVQDLRGAKRRTITHFPAVAKPDTS